MARRGLWQVGLCALAIAIFTTGGFAEDLSRFVGEKTLATIRAAAPASAAAKPAQTRKVLVLTESARDLETAQKNQGMKFVPHSSAPHCALAVAILGEKTGAFDTTIVSDPKALSADGLKGFDAIVLANVYLESKLYKTPRDLNPKQAPEYEARQKALLEFVRGGGVNRVVADAAGRKNGSARGNDIGVVIDFEEE